MPRVIISGDRTWSDRILTDNLIRRLRRRYGQDLIVVHRGASGIDFAVSCACRRYGVRQEIHAALWDEVLDAGCAFVVACHRNLAYSTATRSLVVQALERGIKVYLIDGRTAPPRRIRSVSDARQARTITRTSRS
jgi:hypothetical protein